MARDFEAKLTAILDSDLGRWVAQRPNSVATFIKFDTEQIDLTDDALNRRRTRLAAARDALLAYRTKTQGVFDPSKNESVKTILEDANWVEERYVKLRERLAVLNDYEANFPKNMDFSGLPTMREAKNAQIARMVEMLSSAEFKGKQKGAEEAANEIEKSAFDLEIEKAKTQVAGNEMLAALERKLLEAEFGRRAAETEKKITKQFIERQAVKDDTVTMVAESEDERLKKYLKSSRVRNLLAPFCAKGFCEPVAGVGFRRNDSLTKVPMSISKIAIQGTLSPNQGNMKNLIAIATNPDNDRPAWSINYTNYADDEDDFENMDGEKVNRYVEAQRILREHGLELVELGIMRN